MSAPRARRSLALLLAPFALIASVALLGCGDEDRAVNADAERDAGGDTGANTGADTSDVARDAGTDAAASADAAPERACPTVEPWPVGRHPGPCVVEGEDTNTFEDAYTWSDAGRIVRVERFINFSSNPARVDEYSYSSDGNTQTIARSWYGELTSTRTTVTGPHGVESDRFDVPDGTWSVWEYVYDDDGCLVLRTFDNSSSSNAFRYGVEFESVDGVWTQTDRALGRSDLVNVTTLTPWGDRLEYTEYIRDRVSYRLVNTFDADGNQLTGDKTGDLGAETTTYDYSCW